jgi:hypothetical protein
MLTPNGMALGCQGGVEEEKIVDQMSKRRN